MKGVGKVLNAPGNILNAGCNGIKTVFNGVKNGIVNAGKKIGNFFKGIFGKRRKRDGCGIPSVVPDVHVDVPGKVVPRVHSTFYNR